MSAEQREELKRLADDALNKTALQSPLAIEAVAAFHAAIDAALPGVQPYSEMTREQLERHAARMAQALKDDKPLAFWQRYARQPMMAPSCLVCGQLPEKVAITHGDLPGIVVCEKCRQAAHTAEPPINAAAQEVLALGQQADLDKSGSNAPGSAFPAPPASAAPHEPVAPLPSADDLYDKIEEVLLHHRLSNWCMDEDGEELLPLVDRLCDEAGKDISSGKHEIRLICDAIYNEVLTKEAAPQAVDAPVAPFAWYSAKIDDCITDAKKRSRAKVQPWDAEHFDQPLYALKAPAKEPEGNADV